VRRRERVGRRDNEVIGTTTKTERQKAFSLGDGDDDVES